MLHLLRVGRTGLADVRQTASLEAATAEHLAAGVAFDLAVGPTPGVRGDAVPGPLCHLAPAMIPGTSKACVWLIGWGNTNNAGMGSSRTLARVKVGEYAGQAPGGDDTDGNPWFWGFESLHPGTTTSWPDALVEAGHLAACAVCQVEGWSPESWAGSVVEHRQWTTRKIDRSWTGDLQDAIERLSGGPMTTVDLTDAAVAKVAAAVLDSKSSDVIPANDWRTGKPLDPDNPTWRPAGTLGHLVRAVAELRDNADADRAAFERLAKSVEDLCALVARIDPTALQAALAAQVEALRFGLVDGRGN
jgi:hypothetical protein